jgi:hypothetical protein
MKENNENQGGTTEFVEVIDKGFFKISNPRYKCPKHGETEEIIHSPEGNWCGKCALELLDKLGVHRVEVEEVKND